METNNSRDHETGNVLTPGGMMPSEFTEINPHLRDGFYLFFVLLVVSLTGATLWKLGFNNATVLSVYFLGILGVSIVSESKIFGVIASCFSFLIFIFLFTEPLYTFKLEDKGYLVSFLAMLFTSFFANYQMTRVKAHIKQAAEVKVQAEQERLRATMLRSISHDLRTPLTTISGNAGLLVEESNTLSDEKKEKLYRSIYYDSLWLNSVVENLLSITQIEDGKMQLNMEAELITEVIEEALEHVSVNKNNHHIRVHVPDEFLMAEMDLRLILQVIINLIENALKYTPQGSEIVITANRSEDKVLVQISDNGFGIPEDKKAHVFDMFYSDGNSYGDNRRGLGLGLALCKAIMIAHQEEITLRDNVPKGTIFEFSLNAVEVNCFE